MYNMYFYFFCSQWPAVLFKLFINPLTKISVLGVWKRGRQWYMWCEMQTDGLLVLTYLLSTVALIHSSTLFPCMDIWQRTPPWGSRLACVVILYVFCRLGNLLARQFKGRNDCCSFRMRVHGQLIGEIPISVFVNMLPVTSPQKFLGYCDRCAQVNDQSGFTHTTKYWPWAGKAEKNSQWTTLLRLIFFLKKKVINSMMALTLLFLFLQTLDSEQHCSSTKKKINHRWDLNLKPQSCIGRQFRVR